MVADRSLIRVPLADARTLAPPAHLPVYSRTQVLVGLVILGIIVVTVLIGIVRRGR